jgi:AcrR family transcriptional regulator
VATQAERSSQTRNAIIGSARKLFVAQGYAATSVSDILDACGVSRGALYHHFPSKEDIFAVVFSEVSFDAIRRAGKRVNSSATPLTALVTGCLAWVDIATEPTVARVLFQDGPLALGWERCRTLEDSTSLFVMRRSIQAALDSGEIQVGSVDIAARLINGLLAEAALELTRTAGQRNQKREVTAAVTAMIHGLAVR